MTHAETPTDLSPIPTERLRASLERAGQLVGVHGTLPATINAITDDSRRVVPGSCFVALRGSARDSHEFLPTVGAAGATCAIAEAVSGASVPVLQVRDGRVAAAVAAAAFYGEPATALRFVGVTGTNGKSTTVGILRHLLDAPDAPAASIGTLGVLVGGAGAVLPGGSGLTTPGPIELQRVLRALVDAGVRRVAMECSSHALDQGRVVGVRFDAAVFTNLTRDHLDYHGTMEAYRDAKAKLVGLLGPEGTAVVNADDRWWDGLPAAPRRLTFALAATADVRITDLALTPSGSAFTLVTPAGAVRATLPLMGDFNVANALGAVGAALTLGLDPATIAARLATVPQVSGRLELLGHRPTVLRDYAHTPDAYERVLTALRPYTPGRIILVFGCGGDRDRGKRPLMAAAAHRFADHLVLTDDNPRTEDPERILDDIGAGLPVGARYDRIRDRREAIARAIAMADPERDLVLLVGKGPDTYQIYGTTKTPFDEKTIVEALLAERSV